MREISSYVRTEIIESEDGTKRYSLRKVWDESKPSLAIVMLCPSSSGVVSVDTSTALTMANCYRLGYGSVIIVNLFSRINDFALKEAQEIDEENLQAVVKAAESADCFVMGAGTGKLRNKVFQRRLKQVATALLPYQEKVHCLCDAEGKSQGLHPLSPRVREWSLVPMQLGSLIDVPVEVEAPKKKGNRKVAAKQKEDT